MAKKTAQPPTGIVTTDTGLRAFARVKGRLYSKRFARNELQRAKDWRAAKRTEVLAEVKAQSEATPEPGTFADDVTQKYLPAVKAMPTYKERKQHLEEWIALLGPKRTSASITGAEVRAGLHRFHLMGKKGGPLSESATNHRRTALMHFFTVLNGKGGPNPVKEVPRFREPDPEPRGVDFDVLRKVFDAMPDTKTKARVLVMALTGLPHATLMRMGPESIDYQAQTMTAPRRRKGKGTKTRTVPLTEDALAAFRYLNQHDGWGPFSASSLRRSLHRACDTAGVPRMRGYDLRHSFGTAAYKASGDIKAVQDLLDHSDSKLTARYTMAAVDERMKSALDAMRRVTGPVTTKKKRYDFR